MSGSSGGGERTASAGVEEVSPDRRDPGSALVPPPGGVATLVGREREQAEVRALLRDARLVTLIGPGGSGKTRLALAVAADVGPRLADGACWVDLAGVREPGMVAAAAAAAVGAHERPGEGLVDTLVERLRERRLLVLFDNCEHLVDACAALVTALLSACPQVTVLTTSREPLAVAGEVSFTVPPLPVPTAGARSTADVAEADAARLFVLRARQVRPGFRITDDNAAAVAEICRRLDGIPLALELAAARVRVLAPAQIAAGLSDRFRLLTGGVRGAPARQRTLEASVEWSYALLDDAEQLVLARLSVFTGSFGLDAAQVVAAGEGVEEWAVLDLLTGLVDRSLVQVSERDGQARYRLLETIRLYAWQRLADLDDPGRVRDRHLEFFVALAERARAGLTGPEPEVWLARLRDDLEDLRAAMDWAMDSQRPMAVLDIAEPTYAFWIVHGLYVEMHRRLRAAVESPAAGDAERASGLTTASILALMGGDFTAGYAFAAEAVPLARAVGDEAVLARALVFRSWCGFYSGKASGHRVWADSEEAIALAERLGEHETHARALMYAGTLAVAGRSVPGGRAQLEGAIAAIEEGGFTYMLVPARAFAGSLMALLDGQFDEAREHARQALQLGERIGLQAFVSLALAGLGASHMFHGDEHAAREHLVEARSVAKRSGLPTFDMLALRSSAMAEYRFGRLSDAVQMAEELGRTAREAGSRFDEAVSDWLLGVLALCAARDDEAREHLQRARTASVDPPYPFSLGRSLLGLAQLAQADDDLEEAWELAHEGLEVLAAYGDGVGVSDALEVVAGLATPFGRPAQALRLLVAVDRSRTEMGIGRFPLEAGHYQHRVTDAQAQLEPAEAEDCWAEGWAMPTDEAIGYARRGRGARGRPGAGWAALTPAERDVVRLVVDGHTNAEIGERLFVSVNTVKTHLSHVYAKLGVEGRAELAAKAARREI